jgi:hypothetical protein
MYVPQIGEYFEGRTDDAERLNDYIQPHISDIYLCGAYVSGHSLVFGTRKGILHCYVHGDRALSNTETYRPKLHLQYHASHFTSDDRTVSGSGRAAINCMVCWPEVSILFAGGADGTISAWDVDVLYSARPPTKANDSKVSTADVDSADDDVSYPFWYLSTTVCAVATATERTAPPAVRHLRLISAVDSVAADVQSDPKKPHSMWLLVSTDCGLETVEINDPQTPELWRRVSAVATRAPIAAIAENPPRKINYSDMY